MNESRNQNQLIVHDAAANLFWTLAAVVGFDEAENAVIDSSGQCLLEQSFTAVVLGRYGIEKLSRDGQQEFVSAIASEAERFIVKGENMNGVIYAEDAQSGRSPSGMHVNAGPLRAIPKRVSTSGAKIEVIGSLCLRHPLPAVVFSEKKPHGGVLEVADTSASLGFHLPMFLANAASQQIGEKLFVSTGIFHIPVPDVRHGDMWVSAIQNSIRFVSGAKFILEDADTAVDVLW